MSVSAEQIDARDRARRKAALPQKGSGPWDLTVRYFARFGRICEGARMIWKGVYPPELVAEAKTHRTTHLRGEDPCACAGCKFLEDPPEAAA